MQEFMIVYENAYALMRLCDYALFLSNIYPSSNSGQGPFCFSLILVIAAMELLGS